MNNYFHCYLFTYLWK